jgi:hypothetical protein
VHPDQIQNGDCQSISHVVLDNSGGAIDAEAHGITAGLTLAAIKMTLALLPAGTTQGNSNRNLFVLAPNGVTILDQCQTSLSRVKSELSETMQLGRFDMVSQCANPDCGRELHYLRDGKVYQFVLSTKTGMERLEHFWLCGECSKTTILTCVNQSEVKTKRLIQDCANQTGSSG